MEHDLLGASKLTTHQGNTGGVHHHFANRWSGRLNSAVSLFKSYLKLKRYTSLI